MQYNEDKKQYVESKKTILQTETKSVISAYSRFANYIFAKVINNQLLLDKFDEAYEANEEIRDHNREEIYEFLKEEYELMKEYNYRQLHFHFPDGTSFLRFHKKEIYGDELFDIRETIRLANIRKEYVFGFEEGRIYNGYRFVYPLFNNEKHIGTVEISVSLTSVMNTLEELYPNNDIIYVLDEKIVNETVFESQQTNYVPFFALEKFVMDKEAYNIVFEDFKNDYIYSKKETKEEMIKTLNNSDDKIFKNGFTIKIDSDVYLGIFIPINNILEETVGYYIALEKDNMLNRIELEKKVILSLIGFIFIMIYASIIILIRNRNKLNIMANHDNLTGLFNRHYFIDKIKTEFARHMKLNKLMSVIIFDIDHFKKVNDKFGHEMGDIVLKKLANIAKNQIREVDTIARWGGEEFIILLLDTDEDKGFEIAEKIRIAIKKQHFNKVREVTISLGISQIEKEDQNIDMIIDRADAAMYTSKKNGRNKTTKYIN